MLPLFYAAPFYYITGLLGALLSTYLIWESPNFFFLSSSNQNSSESFDRGHVGLGCHDQLHGHAYFDLTAKASL